MVKSVEVWEWVTRKKWVERRRKRNVIRVGWKKKRKRKKKD